MLPLFPFQNWRSWDRRIAEVFGPPPAPTQLRICSGCRRPQVWREIGMVPLPNGLEVDLGHVQEEMPEAMGFWCECRQKVELLKMV